MDTLIRPAVASLINARLESALLDGAVLLTANQRQSRAFGATFNRLRLEAGEKAWQTPRIMTFDHWLQSLYEDAVATGLSHQDLLSDVQSLQIWRMIVIDLSGPQLLSAATTAQALSDAWKTEHSWQRGPQDNASAPGEYAINQDQRFYRKASQEYIKRIDNLERTDQARTKDLLLPLIREKRLTLPTSIWLTGFMQLTSGQMSLLDALAEVGVSVESDYHPESVASSVGLLPCDDSSTELSRAAAWARQTHSETTGYIGVVIPDLHSRRTEVLRTFDRVFFPGATPEEIDRTGRPYDISYGQALTSYASIDAALLCLSLGFGRIEGTEITRLLLSPHFAGSDTERSARSALDSLLRKNSIRTLSLDSLLKHCRGTLPVLCSSLEKIKRSINRSPARPSEWFDRMIAVLQSAGWPGSSLSSAEHEAIETWRALLEQLGQFDDLSGKLNAGSMLWLLRDLTRSRVFQPRTDDVRIQILGVLEAQGLRYDALWVSGMDNESWPMRQSVSPFIPFDWQRKRGVPGADVELDLLRAKKLVGQWTESAAKVLFSHSMSRDGNELSAARHVADFPQHDGIQDGIDSSNSPMGRVRAALSLEHIDDSRGPETPDGVPVKGGARLFEDQASCPFKAFAMHRLAIKPLEEPVLGLDPRDKGTVFHDALDFFWRDIVDHASLSALTPELLEQTIESSIDEAMQGVKHDSAMLLSMEKARLQVLIRDWLMECEMGRTPFKVVEREAELELEFESLNLKLQVDRIDYIDGVGSLIIDYKTGLNNSALSWASERITSPQLPLYAINREDVMGVGFAQVARGKQRFIGLAVDSDLVPGLKIREDWAALIDEWREHLGVLGREIQSGTATITPTKNACTYCALPGLCRIDTQTLNEQSELPGADQAQSGNSDQSPATRDQRP